MPKDCGIMEGNDVPSQVGGGKKQKTKIFSRCDDLNIFYIGKDQKENI